MLTTPAKTIVSRTKNGSAWFGMEYNMNLYRGCCHGCLYCDSRSDCYHVEQFDTVRVKENALEILRNELSRRVITGVVGTGAMSDPYNPFEKEELATRHALQLLDAYGFGIGLATKSDLILRDVDILSDIAGHSPVLCKITLTTTDDALASRLEPRAPLPSRRLAAIEGLAARGLFTGVLMMPIMPFITDNEQTISRIVHDAADAGARFIYPSMGVTMRAGQREYLLAGLDRVFPGQDLADTYRRRFGSRYHCSSPRAKQLWAHFTAECDKRGLLYKMQDIISAYRAPYRREQLSFL